MNNKSTNNFSIITLDDIKNLYHWNDEHMLGFDENALKICLKNKYTVKEFIALKNKLIQKQAPNEFLIEDPNIESNNMVCLLGDFNPLLIYQCIPGEEARFLVDRRYILSDLLASLGWPLEDLENGLFDRKKDPIKIQEQMKYYLKEKRIKLKEIKTMQEITEYITPNSGIKVDKDMRGVHPTIIEYLNREITVAAIGAKGFYDKDVCLDSYIEKYFDLDKTALFMADSIIDRLKNHYLLNNEKEVPTMILNLYHYQEKLNQIENYNPFLKDIDGSIYSYEDFKKRLNHYISTQYIEPEKNLQTKDGKIEFYFDENNHLQKRKPVKKLLVGFDIIPNGHRMKNTTSLPKTIEKKESSKKTPMTELELEAMRRKGFFEGTNYLFQIKGVAKMVGYTGYLYENGTIIFDKFYKGKRKKVPASYEAIYTMKVENFLKISEKSKTEIIHYINDANNPDAQHFYHGKNWRNKVNTIIESGEPMDESTLLYIHSIYNHQEIDKLKKYKNQILSMKKEFSLIPNEQTPHVKRMSFK